MIRALLKEADRRKCGLITWRWDGDYTYCFASGVKVPHVARGRTGVDALRELLAFVRRVP